MKAGLHDGGMSETVLLGSALSSDRSSHQGTQETQKMLGFYAKREVRVCSLSPEKLHL